MAQAATSLGLVPESKVPRHLKLEHCLSDHHDGALQHQLAMIAATIRSGQPVPVPEHTECGQQDREVA
jgi:hypothetical protein